MTDLTTLAYAPATALVEAIRARRVSPIEVLDDVLERAERLQPTVHAFVTLDAERARAAARAAEAAVVRGDPLGPLHGLPVSVKDLEPTAGLRTTYGSKFFEDFVPDFDGAVAGLLRASGAIIFGKTNTPHFGHKDSCDNLIGPPTRNPWNLARTSGHPVAARPRRSLLGLVRWRTGPTAPARSAFRPHCVACLASSRRLD